MKTATNWTVIVIALFCSILMFLRIKSFLLSSTGTFGPTILQAQSPGPAIVALLIALATCTVIACLVSRILCNKKFLLVDAFVRLPTSAQDVLRPHESLANSRVTGTSLLIIGIGLGWTCLQLESIQTVVLDGSMGLLALEGLLWAIALLIMTCIVLRFGGNFVTAMQNDDGTTDDWATSNAAIKMAACGACVLPVVWLIAQSPLKGQVVIATTVGAVAAGLVGRLVAPTVQPVLLFPAVCVFGALGQWVVGMTLPDDPSALVAAGQLPNLVLPLPIDYAAGAMIGIPIGISWGNGFIEKQDAANAASA